MLGKKVNIVRGPFKGHKGTVSQVHGDDAIVELSTRAQKVSILKENLHEVDCMDTVSALNMTDHTRLQHTTGGGNSHYEPRKSVYGGASCYGATGYYDGGKTPMMFANNDHGH